MTVPGGLMSLFGGGKVQADTGWVYPGFGENQGFGQTWSNPTNIYTNNDVDALVTLTPSDTSRMLRGYLFGLSVPTTATILGIEARGEFVSTKPTGLRLDQMWVTPGVALAGTDPVGNQNLGLSRNIWTYGGPTYLWGQTWTPSDVNGNGFSVQVRCSANSTQDGIAYCDWLQVKVYYEY